MKNNLAAARWTPFVVLGIGLLAVSLGGILARVAQGEGVASLAIATWRLGLAALLVTPLAIAPRAPAASRQALAGLTRRQLGLAIGAGLFLALHFATWITSLEYTSVASSTALVSTTPLWIGLANFALWRERPGKLMAAGIALSLAGSLFIFQADSQHAAPGRDPQLGKLLAVAGSWSFAGYLLLGRSLRAVLPLPAYIWLAYGAAALFLLAASLAGGVALGGFPDAAWLALLGLALGPQLLGHTSYNWSLRHVSATFVAIVTLGEPVVSAALAFVVFGEGFTPWQAAGFTLLLAGIWFAARSESK